MGTAAKVWTKTWDLAYLLVLPSLLLVLMKGDDDDTEDVETMTRATALESALMAVGGVPVASDVAQAMVTQRPLRAVPWLDMLADPFITAWAYATTEEVTDYQRRQALEGVGMITNLPTGGILNGLEYAEKYLNSDMEEPIMNMLFRTPKQAQ